jgi:hypothetical protein
MSETVHDEERREQALFVVRHALSSHRDALSVVVENFHEANATHFDGHLVVPHYRIGRTAPRSLAHFSPVTGYGARVEVTFSAGLLTEPNPAWVQNPWPAPGVDRFVTDLQRRLMVRQFVLEVRGADERGYRGYGPLFTEEANRIGEALGLDHVVEHRRGGNEYLAANWPHCVRPDDYYLDDLTAAAEDMARGTRNAGRVTPAPPGLGEFELIQALLHRGRIERAREVVDRHVEWLRSLRERKVRRRNSRIERGLLDVDGETELGFVGFDRAWLDPNFGAVRHMAEAARERRDFSVLPILADALEEAGCDDPRILRHLRAPIEHTRHCWVLRRLTELTHTL